MSGVKRGLTLVSVLIALLAGCGELATAQSPLPTTTVQDTVYSANGTPASGTVLVSWGPFTTASGASVPAGRTSATIGANGVLTIALAPDAGATPLGSYYTATFHLSDGTTSRQYWIVPVTVAGGGPAKLSAIQNEVLPTSVAMQTVSKAYVDNAIATAVTGRPADTTSVYVLKTGDAMTGPLVLPADPVSPNQAADKNYVDENVTAVASGVGGKVSLLPSGTQVVSQPSGTQLDVNLLNGEVYANEYLSGFGNNGIANALASADCATGCEVKVQPTYSGADTANIATFPAAAVVIDQRGGADMRTTLNPTPTAHGDSLSASVLQTATLTAQQQQTLRPGSVGVAAYTESLSMSAPTGGSNLYPQTIETPPYFKNTYGVLQLSGVYNTQGQHVQFGNSINCYGVGDCLAGSQFITSSGGYRDNADEGAHPFDLQVREDSNVYTGTCTTGCTPGATSLTATANTSSGTQGDGRFLIDKNPAKTINNGVLIGGTAALNGAYLPFGLANFSGTSFPVSVLLQTAQAATSQPANMSPGTVTLPITTSNVPTGFVTSTAALPATTGIACVADGGGGASDTPNYEMANYAVVDTSHITLTLNKVHELGATVSVGGLCGYGIEQTVDTRSGIRQLFPVVASLSATSLYYAESGMAVIGSHSAGSTSAYLNETFSIASIARSGNVVTATVAGNPIYDLNGLTITVAGVADSSYNGSFQVTTTGANTFTYPSAGANSTSSGGSLSYLTGGYVLYPVAEVLSVFNAANKQVDGTFTLAPNTVAWASGDALEEPHYYKQQTYADTELVTQYVPRPTQYVSAGKTYEGLMGVGARGWQIANATPQSFYFGAGGSYNVPDDAYVVSGPWGNDFEVDAGTNAVTRVHCNLYTCGRWDSTYKLFDLDSVSGEDYLYYAPQSDTATWQLGGQTYSFSPQAFTAATINVGNLNATTINGAVPAAAITTGTINSARLPLFGASGSSHAQGVVPDPGAAAGTTRYLREDGTWSTPAGGGTMASQNATAVSVTGGTLNGTAIGETTPAAGAFTSVTTGSLTASGSTGYAYANGNSPLTYSMSIPSNTVSGLAVSATTDATNASNVSSGTLAAARLPFGSSAGVLPQMFARQYDSATGVSMTAQNQYSFNFDAKYLPRFEACMASVRINAGSCMALFIGDSTTFGYYGNNATTGDMASGSYVARLTQMVNSTNFPVNRDAWMGGGSTYGVGMGNDARVTLGSWFLGSTAGIGGEAIRSTAAGTCMTFTPTGPVSSFTVWYLTSPTLGTFSLAIDGGTATNFNEGVTAGFANGTVTAGSVGTHTLTTCFVSGGSGNLVQITGVTTGNSSAAQMQFVNAGWGGSKAEDWASTTNPYSPQSAVTTMAPPVIMLDLAINDWYNNGGTPVPVATYKAAMQQLITAWQPNSDIILVTPPPSQASTTALATQQQYIQAEYELAIANNLPLIDNWSRWGSYEVKSAAPFSMYYNPLHPDAKGYMDFTAGVYTPLLLAMGR